MKIQICSDLHLEFPENRNWLKENPLIPKGDILVIAGDTYYLNRSYHKLDFIKRVADEFAQVYLIPGNHEYYDGYDASTALLPVEHQIKDNVVLLNNTTVEVKGIQLIFSTFWSKIQHQIPSILYGMADFHRIRFKEERFQIEHFNELHEKAVDFVANAVKRAGKKMVITHHLPSYACNAEEFRGSPLNEAFCVEKTDFILENKIDYWVYGHSHRNLADFTIGDTQMITNQFGYIRAREHLSFDYEKVIEVPA